MATEDDGAQQLKGRHSVALFPPLNEGGHSSYTSHSSHPARRAKQHRAVPGREDGGGPEVSGSGVGTARMGNVPLT